VGSEPGMKNVKRIQQWGNGPTKARAQRKGGKWRRGIKTLQGGGKTGIRSAGTNTLIKTFTDGDGGS